MTTEVAEKESNRGNMVRNVLGATTGVLAIAVIALIVVLVGGSAAAKVNPESADIDKMFMKPPKMPDAIISEDGKSWYPRNMGVWKSLERLSLDKIVSRSDAK